EIAFVVTAADGDLSLHQSLRAGVSLGNDWCQLRHDLDQWFAEDLGFGSPDQLLRRTIENADAAVGGHADDAGARPRQHRLGKSPSAVDKVAGAHDVVALGAQLVRHLVKSLTELREISFGWSDGHLNVKIAARDDVGSPDQPADGGHQAV